MAIEITGEPRRVMLPKRTQDGRRVELSYTIVPTTHGKLVMFDRFAKKLQPGDILARLASMPQTAGRSPVHRVNVGNLQLFVKQGERGFNLHPLREALVLEDLHYNGIRCEPPVAVFLYKNYESKPWTESLWKHALVTVGSRNLPKTFGVGTMLETEVGRKISDLGYSANSDLQAVGRLKPRVVIDVEGLSPTFRFKAVKPLRIERRARLLLREAFRTRPQKKKIKK